MSETRSESCRTPHLEATARATSLERARCVAPAELYERLRQAGHGVGAVLLESADHENPVGHRSLVLPRPLVRLVVRGREARFTPLVPEASVLLDALAARVPGARAGANYLDARMPDAVRDPAMSDLDALRAPSVLDALRLLAGLVHDTTCTEPLPGAYGAFSYELLDLFETLPRRRGDPFGDPDLHFVLALDAVLNEHARGEVRVVTRALRGGEAEADAGHRHEEYLRLIRSPSSLDENFGGDEDLACARADVSDREFLLSVERFLERIRDGDIFQGVLSRGLAMESPADPLAVYRALRARNPSPYMFHVDLGDGGLLGASPETCVRVVGGELALRPIAGTAPRGFAASGAIDHDLDARLAIALLLDRKEQAEHVMLVDLARNDVARVCAAGTRRVDRPLTVEKYSHVQHLVSEVRGRLQPGLDALHAYRACANMGTVTGAPKLRAMELIREAEPTGRGFYGGAVGYLLEDGAFDSCLVIRSLRYRDGLYHTRAGAGIVAGSTPRRELEETEHKARACRAAVGSAARLCRTRPRTAAEVRT
jgi:anthranilate synthase component 1